MVFRYFEMVSFDVVQSNNINHPEIQFYAAD